MPKEMSFSYSSLSYQEKIAPPPAPTFILAIIVVFSCCRALRELAAAMGSAPGIAARGSRRLLWVWMMGYDNNVYVQIGLVMLIGLAAKKRYPDNRVRESQSTKRAPHLRMPLLRRPDCASARF